MLSLLLLLLLLCVHPLPKGEVDLPPLLPATKKPRGQHLKVVIPHLVICHHAAIERHGRVQPKPVVVATGRRFQQQALGPPRSNDARKLAGERRGMQVT